MKCYYGLTEEEINREYLFYEKCDKYKYKGINTSLDGLRKIVIDNGMENLILYYTIIDSREFDIVDEVLFDEKYDMVAVKIPFKIKINNINKMW